MYTGIFQYQFSIFDMQRNSHAKNDDWLAVRQGCCRFTIEYTGSNGTVRTFLLMSLVCLIRVPSQDKPVCEPGCVSALCHLLKSTPPDQPNTQSQRQLCTSVDVEAIIHALFHGNFNAYRSICNFIAYRLIW